MKNIRLILAVMCLIVMFSASGFTQSYVITNATVVTVTSGTITNGTVVIEDGKITAVGTDVTIPAGAERIDASGKFVYPGMIDINTSVGLSDVSGIWQTTDNNESGTYMPYLKASQAINYNNRQINVQRFTGVTSVISVPRGGVLSGQEVLLNLDGWSLEELTAKDPVSMQMTFPTATTSRRRGGPAPPSEPSADAKNKVDAQVIEVKDLLEKTRRYIKACEEYKAEKRPTPPPADMVLKALIPVVKGEIPFTITVNGVKDMRKAMKFVKEEKVKAVFVGASDAYKIASELAKAKIPIAYSDLLKLPGMEEPYDLYYSVPNVLYKAGVKFVFSISAHANVRMLPFLAGMSAAYGLPKEEALKAVTIYPAEIYGVDDILGSIEAGKMANVVITDGDLLEPKTHVEEMFIAGKRVDLKASFDYQMYDKYRKRPVKK